MAKKKTAAATKQNSEGYEAASVPVAPAAVDVPTKGATSATPMSGLQLRFVSEVPAACAISDSDVKLLASGRHPDPASLLGLHLVEEHIVFRCWVSGAKELAVKPDQAHVFLPLGGPDAKEDVLTQVPLQKVLRCPPESQWLFEGIFLQEGSEALKDTAQLRMLLKYELQVKYDGSEACFVDPYSLGALLSEPLLEAFTSGEPQASPAKMFGSRHMELRSVRPGLWGTRFAVWAPHAKAVSVVGDFNFWNSSAHPMCSRSDFGVWELFIPTWDLRGQKYQYVITPPEGEPVFKTDAFAQEFADPVFGAHDAKVSWCDDYSREAWGGEYKWYDAEWMQQRATAFSEENWASQPLSIYEVHLSTWATGDEFKNYRAIAEPLAKHVQELGFTAVELMPVSAYPCDASWGYQCAAGLYAVDSRLGTPDDFKFLVDTLHRHNIAVHMDFVGAHFAKDPWGLVNYSGAPQFEYEGELGELPGWGTARFNYGKAEVRSYLFGAVEFWITNFHIDGLRLDAVAPMVYKSFGREEDGDAILAGRGVVNDDGVAFLRDLCTLVKARHPGVIISAEESTNFKWTTSRELPTQEGSERATIQPKDGKDLGFHLKWNMGFSYDTLAYMKASFGDRPRQEMSGQTPKLAWYASAYAYNERWVLPFSHDNVQPLSMLDQMTAPHEAELKRQLAHFRMTLMYTIGMPGRPLLFMGTEIGEGAWSYKEPIDWKAAEADPMKQHLKSWVAQMLHLYRELPALHRQDDEVGSFVWLDKDSSRRCVYSWLRRATGAPDVIFIVNASPNPVAGHQVPVGSSCAKVWRCAACTSLDAAPGANNSSEPVAAVVVNGAANFAVDLQGCAAQLWVADEEASSVKVELELRHPNIAEDDTPCIIGGCQELGDWQTHAAPKFVKGTDGSSAWRLTLEFALGTETEYKFITMKADGAVCWEPFDGNRRLQVAGVVRKCLSAEFGQR